MSTKRLKATILWVHFILVFLVFDVDFKHYREVDCKVPYFNITDTLPSKIMVRVEMIATTG